MKEKRLLKDVAYEEIKKKILNREVKHMSENSLVEELKMSRTPIREALHRLEHEGFLKIISNQGIIVSKISVNRLNDLIDMRISIETFSLKQAVKIITENDYQEIEKIITKQKDACKKNDLYLFKEMDANFHKYLLNITGNYYFLKMFTEAHELQFMARERKITQDDMERLIKEHEIIIFYLRNNEIDQAILTLEHHLNGGKEKSF